ncbi:hypothetical protein VTK73DRAFT_295 [Phialemonium thermophilum]|uniref:Xylanolytic transcriptional activator regulatory domain-containing protein n=1 Tax=Phialemonium thermophilum TaxID=223376 RepID=A0ABR3XEP1_9PEZI
MTTHFRRLCLDRNGVYPSYVTQDFPSLGFINFFIRLFFENFDPILPIYNTKVANMAEHWILALSVSAIGSQYADAEELSRCVVPLHEFLRRALAVEVESGSPSYSSLPLAEALVLSQIGMMYYGSERLRSVAKARRGILSDIVNDMGYWEPAQDHLQPAGQEPGLSLESMWRHWLLAEARRRLAYAIWLVDCMAVYHFGLRPLFTLESARWELPQDELWGAPTAEEWFLKYKSHERNPSLMCAVHTLFLSRQMKADLGEYSNLLLLHGVYQEIFKVKDFFSRELSTWTPSVPQMGNGSGAAPETTSGLALQRHSPFEKWRSAAMDCVDVLHWAANGVVAKLQGAEHATVLHLQFSRVVLWSPYEKVQELAAYLASLTESPGRHAGEVPSVEGAIQAESEVLQWAQMDEHKARLAALHCGCFFWHVRRYSCKAFYEPVSVFLATLVLWAYSVYAPRAPLPYREGEGDDAQGIPNPTFVHLDRPCDDEMVQFFVRSGRPSVMGAYVAGVGNIYEPSGPAGILREGRKLLVAVSTAWGRTAEYLRVLKAVERHSMECHSKTGGAFVQEPSDNGGINATPLS